MNKDQSIPTRPSLLNRLKSWDNQESWREFFDAYGPLVYGFALKAGLDEAGAQDAVQETIISVAKQMPAFQYDPAIGSFKHWLLQIARRRVVDLMRQRYRQGAGKTISASDPAIVGKLQNLSEPGETDLDRVWDEEWREKLASAASERVKRKVRPEQYQMFELAVLQRWPAGKVAEALGATRTQVYMARHRVGKLIRKEIGRLEKKVL